jgi:twitching motility protein PilT
MNLANLIALAQEHGASDLHLEPGLPAAIRIRGALKTLGEPLGAPLLTTMAQEVIGTDLWDGFLARRSFDCSRTIQGTRCRLNLLHSSRGIGFAIRLLSSFQATLDRLNLNPDLRRLISSPHGLVLISGRTGSGKSSTLAGLIQEINLTESRHILTIESPIEYTLRPRLSFIRQREVGRDTPSFEQALIDALREDPDVLMVGEMREPETMRLTLNAAETGHLVLTTVHAATCTEALQRILLAFSPEIQHNIAAQLADCLLGVVAQRLVFRSDLGYRIPECEVLTASTAVKAQIRNRDFHKLGAVMETSAEAGMWTFGRYRSWIEKKTNWHNPSHNPDSAEQDAQPLEPRPRLPSAKTTKATQQDTTEPSSKKGPESGHARGQRIEIEPVEGGLDGLLKDLK